MKNIIFVLLGISCSGNIWLLLRASAYPPDAKPQPIRMVDTQIARKAIAPTSATMDSQALFNALARVFHDEPEAALKNLRSAGADDETARAILDGSLRRKYRAVVTARRVEAIRTAWWKANKSETAGMPDFRASVAEPLKKLLGPDPLDLIDAALRYDFLPPDKRQLLAMIDLDYSELQTPADRRLHGVLLSQATTKAEAAEEQLLVQERRKDLLAALTPDERSEFDLRFGGTAEPNAQRLAKLNVSEDEFRAIKPAVDAYQDAVRAALGQASFGLEPRAAQRAVDQIVKALGYDRALEYLWSGPGPYESVISLMSEISRPADNAARLFQLAAETGERAAAIHYDLSLTTDQKKTALLALQGAIRPQLDALVPPFAQSKLPDPAIAWFKRMSDGQHEQMRPMIFGSGRSHGPRKSVTTPVTGPAPIVPVVRRPGG